MNRTEFMEKLRMLLVDVEESEREEALDFYEHYFEDAGVENEQDVIASLESPEKVARTIKEGLNDPDAQRGAFTENGYSGYGEAEKDELRYPKKSPATEKRNKKTGTSGLILLLILAVFALPILGPVLIGIVSAVFGVLVAVAAVLFAMIIVGIALLVAGAAVFASAVGSIFVKPPVSIILFGLSLLLIGIGILAVIFGIWIVTKVIPPIIRFVVRNVRKLFEKKEE